MSEQGSQDSHVSGQIVFTLEYSQRSSLRELIYEQSTVKVQSFVLSFVSNNNVLSIQYAVGTLVGPMDGSVLGLLLGTLEGVSDGAVVLHASHLNGHVFFISSMRQASVSISEHVVSALS